MMNDFDKQLTFQQQLEESAGIKLQIKINDNRSTMLSVKWTPDFTKVSLHRMFLQAPQNVMQALACYLSGADKKIALSIKAFIEDNIQKLDYTHELDLSLLQTKGRFYDLKEIYHAVNEEYFGKELDLYITWFGKEHHRKRRSRVIFGLYNDPLKLIKINRMLDNTRFPDYFISYVVFHEMLHHVCPSYIDERGLKQIHSKEFKHREKQFKYYKQAKQWIKDNQTYLFNTTY
jgi:hypothetical protein